MQKHFFTFVQFLTPIPVLITQAIKEQNVEAIECLKDISKIIKWHKRKTKEELMPIFGHFDLKKISQQNSSYNQLVFKYKA